MSGLEVCFQLCEDDEAVAIFLFFCTFYGQWSIRKAFLKYHKDVRNPNINYTIQRYIDAKSSDKLSF